MHPAATVVGDVIIGRDVYVGPAAAIRGDWGAVVIEDGKIQKAMITECNTRYSCDVIDMLPKSLQQYTIYSAGVTANAEQVAPAKALIKYLASPAAKSSYKNKGLAIR